MNAKRPLQDPFESAVQKLKDEKRYRVSPIWSAMRPDFRPRLGARTRGGAA